MCGITAYYGAKNGVPIVLNGLKRLEYRGYDSAGIVILKERALEITKTKGKIAQLEPLLEKERLLLDIQGGARTANPTTPTLTHT